MLRNSMIKNIREYRKSRKSEDKKKKTKTERKSKTKKSKKKTKESRESRESSESIESIEPRRAVRRASPQKSDLRKGYYNATIVINKDIKNFKSPLWIIHEGKEIGYIYNLVTANQGQQYNQYQQNLQYQHY